MRFEGRELKPYAEPVVVSELKQEAIYFSLTFADDEMLIPSMEPVVFVGKNLNANDVRQVYFQGLDSYRRGARYDTHVQDDHATFFEGSENELGHIFHYERAIDVLLGCSLRRRKTLTGPKK